MKEKKEDYTEKFEKASISSKEVSCDRCGIVVSRDEITSIYVGEHGEKIDLCKRCWENAKSYR